MVQHTAQRPSAVGRLPVEVVEAERRRPPGKQAHRLVDAPQPRIEIVRRQRQTVLRQCHGRRHPAVRRRRHDTLLAPELPLVDLVQVIESVVEDASQRLPRRVGVRLDRRVVDRLASRRIGRLRQAIEELARHWRPHLGARRLLEQAPQMPPSSRVRLLQVRDRIARSGIERPRRHGTTRRRMGEDGRTVPPGPGGGQHPVARGLEGVRPRRRRFRDRRPPCRHRRPPSQQLRRSRSSATVRSPTDFVECIVVIRVIRSRDAVPGGRRLTGRRRAAKITATRL